MEKEKKRGLNEFFQVFNFFCMEITVNKVGKQM